MNSYNLKAVLKLTLVNLNIPQLVLKGSVDKGFITMTLLSAVTAASVKEATLGLAPKCAVEPPSHVAPALRIISCTAR
jgi:hypothetical protein